MATQTCKSAFTDEEKDLLIKHSSDLLVITGFDGYWKRISTSFTKILGWTPEELLAKPFIEFVHPDDREATSREMEAFKAGKEVTGFEDRYLCKDGTYRWICWNAHPLVDKGLIVGVGRDITERKQAEEALKTSEERLRLAWQATRDVIWDWDVPHDLHLWSPAGAEVFGWTDIVESPQASNWWRERLHPEDRQRVVEGFDNVVKDTSRHYWQTEYRFLRSDGSIAHVFDRGYILRDASGNPRRMVGAMQDITERKHMEDELHKYRDELERRVEERTVQLRESEDKYRTLVENVNSIILRLEKGGTITFFNEFAKRFFGYDNEEILGKTVFGTIAPETDSFGRDLHPMFDDFFINPERYRNNENENIRKNGERVWISWTNSPVYNQDGSVREILCVGQDITERKRLEEQLRQSHKMEAIGTLAGGIAHDFNNMLAIIMGNAELALDDVLQPEPRRNLEAILGASKRSRDLVRQILTFSRKSSAEEKAVDMESFLKETQTLLRSTLPTTIRIDLHLHARRGLAVMGDPSKIQQIILNLANNASHAMRKKGGTLTMGLSTVSLGTDSPQGETRSGLYVKLTVKDTGTGISEQVRRRMFEPFFTTKGSGQGTGMGLSVVYGIVKDMNGMIEVESEVGKGTTFTVLFPQADITGMGQPAHKEAVALGKEHILLVDDESGFVESTASMLKRLGYRVSSATNSMVAMRLFTTSPDTFDLIITDQTMPDFTGIELASEARSIKKDIPVILCTGYSETVSDETAKEAGIAEFLMKPITKKQMAQAIRRVLDKKIPSHGPVERTRFQS